MRSTLPEPSGNLPTAGVLNMATFTDLVPTESDAAGVVGGSAFLDLTPVLNVVGVIVAAVVHID
jgi:hypothetical protein